MNHSIIQLMMMNLKKLMKMNTYNSKFYLINQIMIISKNLKEKISKEVCMHRMRQAVPTLICWRVVTILASSIQPNKLLTVNTTNQHSDKRILM
jgi:hypothetical protein